MRETLPPLAADVLYCWAAFDAACIRIVASNGGDTPPTGGSGGSMHKLTETLISVPKRPTTSHRAACLIQIYPTGPGMGTRHTLGDQPMILGRDPDCDLSIEDPSISRRHAR